MNPITNEDYPEVNCAGFLPNNLPSPYFPGHTEVVDSSDGLPSNPIGIGDRKIDFPILPPPIAVPQLSNSFAPTYVSSLPEHLGLGRRFSSPETMAEHVAVSLKIGRLAELNHKIAEEEIRFTSFENNNNPRASTCKHVCKFCGVTGEPFSTDSKAGDSDVEMFSPTSPRVSMNSGPGMSLPVLSSSSGVLRYPVSLASPAVCSSTILMPSMYEDYFPISYYSYPRNTLTEVTFSNHYSSTYMSSSISYNPNLYNNNSSNYNETNLLPPFSSFYNYNISNPHPHHHNSFFQGFGLEENLFVGDGGSTNGFSTPDTLQFPCATVTEKQQTFSSLLSSINEFQS